VVLQRICLKGSEAEGLEFEDSNFEFQEPDI